MIRRKILEKNWKEFRLSTGLKYEPMSDKAYEFMENAMEQYAELRLGGVVGRSELLPCGDLMKHNFSLSKIGRCITCDRAKEKAR
jgi:hypothetical protein